MVIPNALFKIVIRETENNDCNLEALSFIYNQDKETKENSPCQHKKYLVSIDEIEKRASIKFLTQIKENSSHM